MIAAIAYTTEKIIPERIYKFDRRKPGWFPLFLSNICGAMFGIYISTDFHQFRECCRLRDQLLECSSQESHFREANSDIWYGGGIIKAIYSYIEAKCYVRQRDKREI